MRDGIEERLDRLESLVEQQQATIEEQRDRIAELEGEPDGDATPYETGPAVSRRGALTAGGLLALLFGGIGTASAAPQGQVGTSSDPLQTLHTTALSGPITDGGGGPQPLTKLPGDGLAIDGEELTINPGDFAGRNLTASGGDLDYVRPENVLVVAKSGGDYTTVSGALASISDNAADNPYVIRIAPGVYNEQIQLKSYVDIVGSGIHATRIESTQGSRDNATLQGNGATNVEVRQITVQGDASALTSDDGTDISVMQSRIRSADRNSRAVSQYGGTVRLQNCLVEATGTASEGIMVDGGTIDVSHCRVEGQAVSIFNYGGTANVRHSQLVGGSYQSNTFSVCDGSYNGIS